MNNSESSGLPDWKVTSITRRTDTEDSIEWSIELCTSSTKMELLQLTIKTPNTEDFSEISLEESSYVPRGTLNPSTLRSTRNSEGTVQLEMQRTAHFLIIIYLVEFSVKDAQNCLAVEITGRCVGPLPQLVEDLIRSVLVVPANETEV